MASRERPARVRSRESARPDGPHARECAPQYARLNGLPRTNTAQSLLSVSYTHLTLPTKRLV